MAKDVSVVFKASDNLSNSIRQMRRSVDGLSKDVTEYRKIQDDAFNKKVEVKFEIDKAKRELKELSKAVKDNAEGSEKAFKDKQKALEQLNEEYKRLGQVAKDASKQERSLQDEMHKTKNQRNTFEQSSNQKSIMNTLAGAGIINMVGGSVANLSGQLITSTYGDSVGSAVGNIGGGIAAGAAMGMIAGPIGAAIGGALGGLTGAITSLAEKQAKDDDVFKDEVQTLYNSVKQEQQTSLENGKGMASRFEQNMISFSTLLGDEANAKKFLTDIQQFSAATPFQQENLLNTSKTLLSYGFKKDEILPLMTQVGDAGSALGMSPDDINWVATSIGRMQSSGKTSLEYLNPLIERGVPAIRYLSEALGKSQKDVYDMVSKGLIPGADAAKIIADSMGEEFQGNMAKQSKTYEGLLSTLNDTKAQLDKSMGEGYTEKRKEGMEAEIYRMNDIRTEYGDKMKEAYNLIGQYQADLENNHEKAISDAMSNAMDSEDFLKAKQADNGAEMGRIIAEARAKAENEYRNSEGYQLQQETDLQLVKDLQVDTALNNGYLEFGRKMAEQFTIGYQGAMADAANRGAFIPETSKTSPGTYITGPVQSKTSVVPSYAAASKGYATGLDRVPYNNMPAMLHEGERVLTKVEADKADRLSGAVTISKLADNITIREEADIDKIVGKLYSKFQKYAVNTA